MSKEVIRPEQFRTVPGQSPFAEEMLTLSEQQLQELSNV